MTTPGTMSRVLGCLARFAVWAVLAVFSAGFWFHTSGDRAVFGKYSLRYGAAAMITTALLILSGWWVHLLFRSIQGAHAPRQNSTRLAVTALLLFGLMFVAVASGVEFYLTRSYNQRISDVSERARFHPFLQTVPRPGNTDLGINLAGFRGEEMNPGKEPGTYRIFLLGGSTVYCSRVGFEESWGRLLEKRLRSLHPETDIEVQNAGMHWHTSLHSLIKFASWIQEYSPDLVIVCHGINDLCRSFSPPGFADGEFRSDYGHFYGPVARLAAAYSGNERPPRLHSMAALHDVLGRYWFSDFRRMQPAATVSISEWKSLPTFERNTEELVASIRRHGVDVIVASQPSLFKRQLTVEERRAFLFVDLLCRNEDTKPDMASMIEGMLLFNRTARAVADRSGALFVDLDTRVPKTLEFFADDVHYTEAGNELIADLLLDFIESGDLLKHSARLDVAPTVSTGDGLDARGAMSPRLP